MALHPTPTPVLMPQLFRIFGDARAACRQERVWQRLVVLSVSLLTSLGRHTLSQLIVGMGAGQADWSAWYRLWSARRVRLARMQARLVGRVAALRRQGPLVVGLDGTHLPRSSATMPGVGWARCPRTPAWRPGIHRAQRWVGLNALLPRSPSGDSRALPLRWIPAPTAKACPVAGYPARPEWAAGLVLLIWLRAVLDRLGGARRRILVIADGAYSPASLWTALPHHTTLLARCARNRVLFARPEPVPGRGRPRKYGARQPTPHDLLVAPRTTWRACPIRVRGRQIGLQVCVRGPVLVQPAAGVPLFLIVVRGVKASSTHRKRDPVYLLVNARQHRGGTWVLPDPVATLLAWAWQRWELEVMHRELKSGFGLGQQQAWSAAGTVATTQWICWVYAAVLLAGYLTWGYAIPPGSVPGRWWRPRRWSLGMLWQQVRCELWRLGDFQPVWTRSPDTWAEMSTWVATQTNAGRGYRRI